MKRSQQLEKLKKSFDILVIGGGATGCGIALDAASRGLKVALVERGDFSYGTSSRSTKLIHGGVRYLEQAILKFDRSQFNLVRDALRERAILFHTAPHLVRALPIITPIYRFKDIPYYLAGLKMYDRLAGKANIGTSYFIGPERALKRFPMLKKQGLRGGVVYYDGQFDDARTNVVLAVTAHEQGAVVANYVEVTGLTKKDGKVVGATVRDCLSDSEWKISAKIVVNATGPFADRIRRMDDPKAKPMLSGSSGAHIVLSRHFCPPAAGLLIPKTEDGRVLFILPWLGFAIAGTTDNPATVEDDPRATEDDVDYILRQMNQYFAVRPEKKDILATYAGIRPLVSDPRASDTAKLVRDHVVNVSRANLLTIAGGKWTTYRKMALDAMNQAVKYGALTPKSESRTATIVLAGGENYGPKLVPLLKKRFKLPPMVASHLVRTYGSRSERVCELIKKGFGKRLTSRLPYLEAEVVYAVEEEAAQTAMDVLARRTRLAFLDRQAALQALPGVVRLMADSLGWDAARRQKELSLGQDLI